MAEKSYLPAFGVNTFQMPALTGVGLLARSLYYDTMVPLFAGWLPQYPAGPVSDDIQTDVVLKLPDSRHSETLH